MNRFEELLDRFTGLLDRFEGHGGSSTDAPASNGSASPVKRLHKAVKEFDSEIAPALDKFVELGKQHSNTKIHEASEFTKESFILMRNIIQAITESKQEKTENMAKVVSPSIKDLDKKLGKCSRDLNIKNHCRALLDSLQLIQLTIMDDPHDMGKEFLGQIDFYGNKVVQEGKELDTQW